MASLDDLSPDDLPGFSDTDGGLGQASADPEGTAVADEDAPPASADDPGAAGVHPFYDDDAAATGRPRVDPQAE